ncbi:MAG: 4Fe-4S dicluster domain-containing protein [Armatimonadetes bacterium]|nr:4Fe-4S dicluster domain-containing protein [Armatimonadota bacterium]
MAIPVDPTLIREIKRHGAFDVSACFHCGNCSAVCPLSDAQGNFPRRMIRLGQIGDRKRLLDAPEAWLCYYCGECSDTCPREAGPGEYMAAVRRYAVAQAEPTGLARVMYRSTGALAILTLLFAIVLGAFLVSIKAPAEARQWLFRLVPYETVHNVGIGVGGVGTLAMAAGTAGALRRFMAGAPRPTGTAVAAALRRTVAEIATMKRHRSEAASKAGPWFANAAWIHLAIMYGFGGLLLATILDFVFLVILPLHLTTFWPARIIGTLSGAAMMVCVGAAIRRRVTRAERSVGQSLAADWWLLAFLFALGITGFWVEVAVTLRAAGPVQDIVLLIHAAMAMELVLLTAFTKLAHVIYRPIALFATYLRAQDAA